MKTSSVSTDVRLVGEPVISAEVSSSRVPIDSQHLLVWILFFFSGACGLIYEVLWCRQLGLIFGNTTQSITVALTAFMAGLAIGSYVAGRLCHLLKRPLLAYGILESLIGFYCAALPWLLSDHGPLTPLYRSLYGETGSSGVAVARFVISFGLLLVPTIFMGATLPILSQFLAHSNKFMSRAVGTLYAINTFGAVVGAAATGFLLLPEFGKLNTNWIAVACNLTLGALAIIFGRRAPTQITALPAILDDSKIFAEPITTTTVPQASRPPLVHETLPLLEQAGETSAVQLKTAVLAFGITGFAAMVTQIGWTRAISLGTGSSTYAFSLIVAIFILGLGLGGIWGARIAPHAPAPVALLGKVLLVIGLLCMALATLLGYGPLLFYLLLAWGSGVSNNWNVLLTMQAFGIALLIIMPTFLMGATMPLTLQVASRANVSAGRTVGAIYAINTVGAILGSLLGGLLLLPLLQIQATLGLMALLYAALGALLLTLASNRQKNRTVHLEDLSQPSRNPKVLLTGRRGDEETESSATNTNNRIAREILQQILLYPLRPLRLCGEHLSSFKAPMAMLSLLALLLLFILSPAWDARIMSCGLYLLRNPESLKAAREFRILDAFRHHLVQEMLYYREGASATVAVAKVADNISLSVGGKPDASSKGDMGTQIGLTLLPELLCATTPEETLVIGLGSGVSVGSALALDSVNRVDVVEMSPEVVEGSSFFAPFNHLTYTHPAPPTWLATPKVELLINDGRNHLLLTSRRYDVIASEPSNPWMAGVGNLFTKEAFQLARNRLKPGGLMCQWLHNYSLEETHFLSVVRTFGEVFTHLQLWWINGGDYLLIGGDQPIRMSLTALRARFKEPRVHEWLIAAHWPDEYEFLASFIAQDNVLRRQAASATLHTDDNMLLEFAAPRALYATARLFRNAYFMPSEDFINLKDLTFDERAEFLQKLDLAVAAREHTQLAQERQDSSKQHIQIARCLAPQQHWAAEYLTKQAKKAHAEIASAKESNPAQESLNSDHLWLKAHALAYQKKDAEAMAVLNLRANVNPENKQALRDFNIVKLAYIEALNGQQSARAWMTLISVRRAGHELCALQPDEPANRALLCRSWLALAKFDAASAVFYRQQAAKAYSQLLNLNGADRARLPADLVKEFGE
ncbi:MAG: fused MFS/spermidine synthase [Planctomycetota bacterium]